MYVHFLPNFIRNSNDKPTIAVIGAGGTGSAVITHLAWINHTLQQIDKPGIKVTVYDDDVITDANIGRQHYYPSEVGLKKADVIVDRIKRNYAITNEFASKSIRFEKRNLDFLDLRHNIFIVCVDNIASRKDIYDLIKKTKRKKYGHDSNKVGYIIDCGNDLLSGQVFLSTPHKIEQPASSYEVVDYLKSPFEFYTEEEIEKAKEIESDTPSCSLYDAISKQDPFINRQIALVAARYVWILLKEPLITHAQTFVNLNQNTIKQKAV